MKSTPAVKGVSPYSHALWWRRPRAHDRPALYWHIASRALALALWALPRRYRFSTAQELACALAPLVRRTAWYRAQSHLRIDSVNEITLHYLLGIMSNSGALFDPQINVDGAEALQDALDKEQGVLVVAPHALLSLLLFRYLHDIGRLPTIISAAPFVHIYGTRLTARAIQPSPSMMFGLRSVLRSGGMTCAMIDQQPSGEQKAIEVATSDGPIYISDALIRLARRCDANVIFTTVRMDKRRGVVLTFGAPEQVSNSSVENITRDFVAFLQTHALAAVGSTAD